MTHKTPKNGNKVIRMPRTREFLTDRERFLLRSPGELMKLNPGKRAGLFRDARLKGLRMIEALTFLAEHLPEKQLSRIFRPSTVLPLVYHLLGRELKAKSDRRYQLARLLAESSLPMLREKMDKPLESFLWTDFLRVEEMIRTIIPDQGYTAKTVDGKLFVEDAEKES